VPEVSHRSTRCAPCDAIHGIRFALRGIRIGLLARHARDQ